MDGWMDMERREKGKREVKRASTVLLEVSEVRKGFLDEVVRKKGLQLGELMER